MKFQKICSIFLHLILSKIVVFTDLERVINSFYQRIFNPVHLLYCWKLIISESFYSCAEINIMSLCRYSPRLETWNSHCKCFFLSFIIFHVSCLSKHGTNNLKSEFSIMTRLYCARVSTTSCNVNVSIIVVYKKAKSLLSQNNVFIIFVT